MVLFRGRHSARWHQEIEVTITSHQTLNAGPEQPPYFPLIKLQAHTDAYLQRVGRPTISEQDALLTAQVREHQNKPVAIIACAHALSPRCVRHLLRAELPAEVRCRPTTSLYLRTLVAIHHANPGAVDQLEAQCAQSLINLLFPDVLTVVEHLGNFATCIHEISAFGVPNDLLPPRVFESIPRSACEVLSKQLQNLELGSGWKQAYRATSALSHLPGAARITKELLDVSFPAWRVWALWYPDIERLEVWERLTPQQRQDVGDILALDGPDFTGRGKPTLREALLPQGNDQSGFSISHGRLHLILGSASISDAQRLLDRLIKTLCSICSMPSSSTALFVHLCVHNSVDARALQVLEYVNGTGDSSLSKAVLDMFTAPANSVRMSGVLGILTVLNGVHHQPLREMFSSQTAATAEGVLLELQNKFRQHLQSGRNIETAGMNLHDFGKNLQAAAWLQPLLTERVQLLLRHWPSTEDMKGLFNIRSEAKSTAVDNTNNLASMVDTYCMSCLAGHGMIEGQTRYTVEGLIHLWQQPPDRQRRDVAVAIAESSTVDPSVRRRCLFQLSSMSDRFIREVRTVVSRDSDEACVKFARVLVIPKLLGTENDCWRDFLRCMIERRSSTLLDYTFAIYSTADSWLQWMSDIRTIFAAFRENSPALPPVLCPRLHLWTASLSRSYLPVLTDLEREYGLVSGMRWVLLGWEISELITKFLDFMKSSNESRYRPGIRLILAQITLNGGNIREIFCALLLFRGTTPLGTYACMRVLEVCQEMSKDVGEVFLAGWLRDTQLAASDRGALEAIAEILRITVYAHDPVPEAAVQVALNHLDTKFDSIMDQAIHFESIRLTLKAQDPHGTSKLLRNLGIQGEFAAGDSISDIPNSLVDVVEVIGDGEFELLFPLNHKRPFQRTALGIGKVRMLLVRIAIGNGAKAPEFCIHLHPNGNENPGSNASSVRHTYYRVHQRSSIPDTSFCQDRVSRIIYQLNRALWRHLKTGFVSLDATYKFLAATIENIANCCIVCGNSLGGRMWRSTTCQKACSLALRRSSLEVRLADSCLDPAVVDLLLNIVNCAFDCHDPDLLPGCPLKTEASLLQTLQNLPTVSTLQQSSNITASVRQLGSPAESLLSWLCTSYRGFLASATGSLKIPSMTGVYQFVLANAAPELEKAFAVHVTPSNPTTRVVFHGTSLDRLYLILCRGLQSGTGKWQRHGAAYGPGIYLADEPATALSFAKASQTTWPRSSLDTCKVVLGVELAGSKPPLATGIHVATDPTTVVVRYVFMFTISAVAPIARHVEPAMRSAFASLRSGSA
jgi:hypothetical protein